MDLIKIILGIILIALLPSFWVVVAGGSLAAIGSPIGIILLILWFGLLIAGVRLILQGIAPTPPHHH